MAAKRIAQATVNWAALAERVPEHQKLQYLAFKSKSDNYIRKMMSHPENPPAIDWQYYVNTVPVQGLVHEFKQKYEAIKIPVPTADPYYTQLDQQLKDIEKDIADFRVESEKSIAESKAELERINALIPLHLMTLEEVYTHYPELGIDRKDPGFYPHHITQKDMADPPHH